VVGGIGDFYGWQKKEEGSQKAKKTLESAHAFTVKKDSVAQKNNVAEKKTTIRGLIKSATKNEGE